MSNPNGPTSGTDMVLSPRQERLVALRDDMAPGNKPGAIVPRTFAEVEVMCKAMATSGLIPAAYKDKPTDMMLVVMSGAELGLPPMASMRLYHVIEGVARLGAEGVRAIVLQSPDCEYFEFAESSPERAVWIGKRPGRPEKSITWTIDRARKAGLAEKANWKKSPEDMLNARASMQLGRLNWPNIVAGLISREEAMDGAIDVEWNEAPKASVFVAPPEPRKIVTSTGVAPTPIAVTRIATATEARAAYGAGSEVAEVIAGNIEQPPKRRGRPPAEKPAAQPGQGTQVPISSQQSGAGASGSAAGTSSTSAKPSTVSTESPEEPGGNGVVVKDRWGQAVAIVAEKAGRIPYYDPEVEAKAAALRTPTAPPASESTTSSTDSGFSQASNTEPSSGADTVADDLGFEDEDPVDSKPVLDQAGYESYLAKCANQAELVQGADEWISWMRTLGDQKIDAKVRPEIIHNRKLYADRKAKLPP